MWTLLRRLVSQPRAGRRSGQRRLNLEQLEDRTAPAASSFAPDRFEPNQQRSQATDLGSPSFIIYDQLNLHDANDEDWFRFSVSGTFRFNVEINVTGENDFVLGRGAVIVGLESTPADSSLNFGKQTFYLRVRVAGEGTENAIGYRLVISRISSAFGLPIPVSARITPLGTSPFAVVPVLALGDRFIPSRSLVETLFARAPRSISGLTDVLALPPDLAVVTQSVSSDAVRESGRTDAIALLPNVAVAGPLIRFSANGNVPVGSPIVNASLANFIAGVEHAIERLRNDIRTQQTTGRSAMAVYFFFSQDIRDITLATQRRLVNVGEIASETMLSLRAVVDAAFLTIGSPQKDDTIHLHLLLLTMTPDSLGNATGISKNLLWCGVLASCLTDALQAYRRDRRHVARFHSR